MFAVFGFCTWIVGNSVVSWPAVCNHIMLCAFMHKEANKSLEQINVPFILESVAVGCQYEDQRSVGARKKKKTGYDEAEDWNQSVRGI